MESEGCEECEAVRGQAEELCERWSMELESGGNVRFILGAPPTPWYLSCFDIVHSRLTVTQVGTCELCEGLRVVYMCRW